MSTCRFAILVVTFLTAVLASAQPAGRLCLGESVCHDSSCGNTVEPAGHARPFTFSRPDGNTVYFGTVPPEQTRFACSGYAIVELRVAARNIGRRNSVRIAFTQDGGAAWETHRRADRLGSPLS